MIPSGRPAAPALLYDRADTLEAAPEASRAFAVFVAPDSDTAGSRDASRRIASLSRSQAEG